MDGRGCLQAGGLWYLAVDAGAQRLAGTKGGGRRMWLSYAAVAIDLPSDGLMIGSGGAVATAPCLVKPTGAVRTLKPTLWRSSGALRSSCSYPPAWNSRSQMTLRPELVSTRTGSHPDATD